jgi:hypothetical protein
MVARKGDRRVALARRVLVFARKGQLAARRAAIGDPVREVGWYVDQWGYKVNPDDGTVAYTYNC